MRPPELTLDPPAEATIAGIQAAVSARRFRCRDVLERCVDRLDRAEPDVRAWVLVDRQRALRRAEALDALPEAERRPLHGVVLGVKDIIDVAGWPTACGAVRPLSPDVARVDAPVVARLRQAGAILLGKTVSTPFAWLDPPPTRNPWNLERTPGGSSSGSAAAVACGMVSAALGSQTGGSLSRPAAYCGVVALKPSHGRLPLDGIFPLAPSLDHPGLLARTVADLAMLYQVLVDEPLPERGPDTQPLRLARLGGRFAECAEPGMTAALDAAITVLRSAGVRVDEARLPDGFDDVWPQHARLLAFEAAAVHLQRRTGPPDCLPPRLRALLEAGRGVSGAEVDAARRHREVQRQALRPVLAGPTFLIGPAATGAAPGPETTGDAVMNAPWSFLGLPTLALPLALDAGGLPLGLQLIGPEGAETALLRAGVAIESILRRWRTGTAD